MLGYGSRCSWVAVASAAMAAFLTSSALVLSSPSFPITAGIAADVFVKVSTATAGQWEEPALFCNYEAWRTVFHIRKVLLLSPWAPHKKGERRGITWGDFPSLFWTVLVMVFPFFLDCSGGPHIIAADMCLGLSGPACVLGLIWWPNAIISCFLPP